MGYSASTEEIVYRGYVTRLTDKVECLNCGKMCNHSYRGTRNINGRSVPVWTDPYCSAICARMSVGHHTELVPG